MVQDLLVNGALFRQVLEVSPLQKILVRTVLSRHGIFTKSRFVEKIIHPNFGLIVEF